MRAAWQAADVTILAKAWGIPELVAYARIGSTNDEARARAAAGCPAGVVVIADEQTAGRGRSGGSWSAAPGSSLLLSIVLRPAVPAAGRALLGVLPLRAGLAVARAIEEIAAVRAGFKWPNDLLVDGRKLAGILCEGALDTTGGHVVCGVGINIAQRTSDFPEHLRATAASLWTAGAEHVDAAALAGAVVRGLLKAGAELSALTPAELAELDRIDVLRGHEVTIDGQPAGIAHGIAEDGSLRVHDGSEERAVYSGTVRFQPKPEPQP